jgi:glyoxylase I family protein
MPIEVTGLDHLYLAVRDLAVSEAFYDRVMGLLDFRKGTSPVAGEPHRHYYNRVLQITLRPARARSAHDPYAPGLHHLCLRVATQSDVDRAAHGLREAGIAASEPALRPEYDPDYYATFFTDPDGIRLEVVAEVERRRKIRTHWDRLTEFVDPLRKAGL